MKRERSQLSDATVSTTTLSNGLRVVVCPRAELHQTTLALYVRVGSRFETRAQNGISHFLEHMLYRGTSALPTAHEQALAFERLGGSLYAATATDHGFMTITLPPETFPEAIALLADVAQRPIFSSIDIERRIVHEEILEGLDDDGRPIDADNLSRELLYGDHPLGYPITGSPQTLDTFNESLLHAHHQQHYGATNAVLAVAGAFDEQAVLASLEASFASMPPGQPIVIKPPPPPEGPMRFRYVESDGSQTDLRVAFRAPGDRDRDEAATEVLLRVFDDGMSTRLYERICDTKGLCYDVSASFEAFEEDGIFDFSAETHHAQTAEVLGEMLALCQEMLDHGPTDVELDVLRRRAVWGTQAMLDDADTLAGFYGLATLAGVAPTPAARCQQLLDVTREQVRAVAEKIFSPERLAVVAVGVLKRAERTRLDRMLRAFGGR